MVDDGGIPPLPRRVPGASGSPRPTVRVDPGNISEDLRQRVLTAIAHELELDEAERQRTGAGPAIGTGASRVGEAGLASGNGTSLASGSGLVSESGEAGLAAGYGVSPANGGSATSENGSSGSLDIGSGADSGDHTDGG